MSKFRLLPLAMLVASSFAIADDAKVFKYSDNGTPTSFDTTQAGTTYSNTIVTAVYDTLYEYKYLKVPFELKPNLAVALPEVSDDGLTYTIKIKQGVKYSDVEDKTLRTCDLEDLQRWGHAMLRTNYFYNESTQIVILLLSKGIRGYYKEI